MIYTKHAIRARLNDIPTPRPTAKVVLVLLFEGEADDEGVVAASGVVVVTPAFPFPLPLEVGDVDTVLEEVVFVLEVVASLAPGLKTVEKTGMEDKALGSAQQSVWKFVQQ